MAGDDPRFEGCDLAGISLDIETARGLRRLSSCARPPPPGELEREVTNDRHIATAGDLV
jgi:hypothetical protein